MRAIGRLADAGHGDVGESCRDEQALVFGLSKSAGETADVLLGGC